jgi:hypothetical protein
VKLVNFFIRAPADFSSVSCKLQHFEKLKSRAADVLFRRRFVPGTLCYRDVTGMLQELCYRRRCVTETFFYGDISYGDGLTRRRFVFAPDEQGFLIARLMIIGATLPRCYKNIWTYPCKWSHDYISFCAMGIPVVVNLNACLKS